MKAAIVIGCTTLGFVLGMSFGVLVQENAQLKAQTAKQEKTPCDAMIEDWSIACEGDAMRYLGACKDKWAEISAQCLGGEHDPGVSADAVE